MILVNVIVSGYTQSEDEMNGCERLYVLLMDSLSPNCVLMQKEWDDDMGRLASRISRMGNNVAVNIFPYSWGAGKGCVELAKALKEYGRTVEHVVAADPVYHSWFPLRTIQWAFALSGKPINLPSNVKNAKSFVQDADYPRGSVFKAENPLVTKIEEPVKLLHHKHADMEDSILWHMECAKAVQESLNGA